MGKHSTAFLLRMALLLLTQHQGNPDRLYKAPFTQPGALHGLLVTRPALFISFVWVEVYVGHPDFLERAFGKTQGAMASIAACVFPYNQNTPDAAPENQENRA